MSKLYKYYVKACKFAQGRVDAVTLNGVSGYMSSESIHETNKILHDEVKLSDGQIRHFVLSELVDGLYGVYTYDLPVGEDEPGLNQTMIRVLFSHFNSALEAHRRNISSAKAGDKWSTLEQ